MIMKYSRLTIWMLLLPFFACCSVQEPAPLDGSVPTESDRQYDPGQAILLLSEDSSDSFTLADHPETLEALGIYSLERVFPDAGEFEARHRAAGLHRWYKVSYDRNVARTKASGELAGLPGVENVIFPRRKVTQGYFNDPYLYEQWGLVNDGTGASNFKAGADINVQPVWEEFTGGSREVIVAVVDEGIQLDHPDLAGVVLTAEEGSRNFLQGYSPTNILANDHGTHVGGTVAAINNNGVGVCGVAGGLDGQGGVRLMSCIIFSSKKTDYGDDAAALVWAADHGAVIANNSWGYEFNNDRDAAQYAAEFEAEDSPTKSAIDYFVQHAGTDADGNQTGPMKGGLVLFSSGNQGFTHVVPGEYAPVIAVGSFGPDGKMPFYSNYGPWVDILAPGGSDSDYNSNEWILSSVAKSQYAYSSGTSMACPHVTGVAALLVSYFGGPGFTVDILKEALLNGAARDAIDMQGRSVGGGKLDAYGAFQYLLESGDPDKDHIRISTSYTGDWRLKSHETLDVTIDISGNSQARLPVTCVTDCPGVTAECSSWHVKLHIDALRAEPGDYTATVRVGTVAEKSFPFTILPNHQPVALAGFDNQIVNAASAAVATLSLTDHFSDPDGEELSYEVSLSGDHIVTTSVSGGMLTLAPNGYGLATVTVRALDARKTAATASFQVLARNTYQDMDIFPNPVSDWLHVRPATDRTVSVELTNAVGATVYSAPSVTLGPFLPLDIDMRELPGGAYSLSVGGQRFTVTKK